MIDSKYKSIHSQAVRKSDNETVTWYYTDYGILAAPVNGIPQDRTVQWNARDFYKQVFPKQK